MSDVTCYLQCITKAFHCQTWSRWTNRVVHQQDNIIWGPTHKEDQDDGKNYPDCPELSSDSCCYQNHSDLDIAENNHRQGEEEETKQLNVHPARFQGGHVKGVDHRFAGIFLTELLVVIVSEDGVQKNGFDAGQAANQPNCDAAGDCVVLSPQMRRHEGVGDGQVLVKGQQGQKKDGTVEAQEVGTAHGLAHGHAEDPRGQLVVEAPEGETQHEDEIRYHQVYKEDVGHC